MGTLMDEINMLDGRAVRSVAKLSAILEPLTVHALIR